MNTSVRIWVSCLFLLGSASSAAADQLTGVIRLTVLQPADRTSRLIVTIPGDPASGRTMDASGTDAVAINGLTPAVYHVVVTFAVGASASLDLAIGAAETVSLEGRAPGNGATDSDLRIVDRRRLVLGTFFDRQHLREIPAGSGLAALLDTAAPFVIVDAMDTGGLDLGSTPRVGGQAASWTNTAVSFGAFELARAAGATPQVAWSPDIGALQAISVAPLLASPDVASPGTIITLVPRRPGAARQSAIDTSFTAPQMVSTNDREGVPSIARLRSWKSAEVQFGGPVAARAGIFLSASFSDMNKRERGTPATVRASVSSIVAHVVANLRERTQWRFLGSLQSQRRPFGALQQFRRERIEERDWFLQSQVAWEHLSINGSRLELAAGHQRGTFVPTAALLPGTPVDRALDGLVPGPVARSGLARSDARTLIDLPETHGHALRFGVTFAHVTSHARSVGGPLIAELVNAIPARLWVPAVPSATSERSASHLAAYASDRLRVARDLTFDLGLRIGRSTGRAIGAERGVGWNAVLPRVGARWAPALFTAFGGYGRYQADLSIDLLAFGDPGEAVTDVFRWNDVNNNQRFDPGEEGTLVARAGRGPGVASIDPALRAPYVNEWIVGAERRLGSNMVVRASRIRRREHRIVRSVNTGVTPAGYRLSFIPDRGEDHDGARDDRPLAIYDRLPSSFGQDRYLLTNPDGDGASYDQTEIAWELKGRRWWSIVGASDYVTWGRGGNRGLRPDENDQGVIGELLENPNASSYAKGAVFFDRQYVAKWSTGFHAPHDLLVCVVARYQDGQPLSRLVVAPGLAQGPELVNTYRAGRTRFTFTSTVDARIEKGVAIGKYRAAVRLDLYNLANMGLEVEENPISGPDFRRTTAVQPPRALRVGFRVEF